MSIEDVQAQLHDDVLFVSILCSAIVVLAIAGIVLYFSFKKPKVLGGYSQTVGNAVHVHHAEKQAWRKDIEEVVKKYHKNELTQDQACAKLAAIARKYVSRMSGENIYTHTLVEISSLRLKWQNKKAADSLRQTIAALYPTEFAKCENNEQERNNTVEKAAEWVLVLLEGWQSKGQRS